MTPESTVEKFGQVCVCQDCKNDHRKTVDNLLKKTLECGELTAKVIVLSKKIGQLEAQFHETYTDENGTDWERPTAMSYAQVCNDRDEWQRQAEQLRWIPINERLPQKGQEVDLWLKNNERIVEMTVYGDSYGLYFVAQFCEPISIDNVTHWRLSGNDKPE